MHELKPKIGQLNKIQDILDSKKSDILADLDDARQTHNHIVATHNKVEAFAKKFIAELEEATEEKFVLRSSNTCTFRYSCVTGTNPYRVDMDLKFKVPTVDGVLDFDNLKGTLTLASSGRIEYTEINIESVAQCAAPILIAKEWERMRDEVNDEYHSTRQKIKEAANKLPFIDKTFLRQF